MGYMSTRRRVTTSQPHVSFPCDFWTENPQPYFCNLRPSSLSWDQTDADDRGDDECSGPIRWIVRKERGEMNIRINKFSGVR